jgi:hypothetical protein
MTVETKVAFEGIYNTWTFKVNNSGYIETKINNNYSDTLYDFGQILNINHLEKVVKHLLSSWKADHGELIIK